MQQQKQQQQPGGGHGKHGSHSAQQQQQQHQQQQHQQQRSRSAAHPLLLPHLGAGFATAENLYANSPDVNAVREAPYHYIQQRPYSIGPGAQYRESPYTRIHQLVSLPQAQEHHFPVDVAAAVVVSPTKRQLQALSDAGVEGGSQPYKRLRLVHASVAADTEMQADEIAMEAIKFKEEPMESEDSPMEWRNGIEKLEMNAWRKMLEAKNRLCFEKAFAKLRKERLDNERFIRRGSQPRTRAEFKKVLQHLQAQELKNKNMLSKSIIPQLMYDIRQQRQMYNNENGLIKDMAANYKERQTLSVWNAGEADVFKEKFLQHPKRFGAIAASLNCKSAQDCVHYYYVSKKEENYKQQLHRNSRLRKRLSRYRQKTQQQQSQCSVDSLTTGVTTGVTTRQQREQQKKTTGRSAGTERERERGRTAKEELLQQIQKDDTKMQADEIAMEAVKFKEEPMESEEHSRYKLPLYSQPLVEKLEMNARRKTPEAKHRLCFEKAFAKLRKERLDNERFMRRGSQPRSEAEFKNVLQHLQEQDLKNKNMLSKSIIPPLMYDIRQQRQMYNNENGLIKDMAANYKERQKLSVWNAGEADVFKEKFLQHPKRFGAIAASLNCKSAQDCVHYYYVSKKEENYKQQLQQQSQCSVDSLTTDVTTRQQREQQKKTTRRAAGTERKRERRRTAKEELLQQIQKDDTKMQADEIAMEPLKFKEEPMESEEPSRSKLPLYSQPLVEKLEMNARRKTPEAKKRLCFEKAFAKLRKERLDNERFMRRGSQPRSEAEFKNVLQHLQEQDLKNKNMLSKSIIPPLMYDIRQQRQMYNNENGLIKDMAANYKERQTLSVCNAGEADIFKEKFLQHPKRFGAIAASLNCKSAQDCVHYYYVSKKEENYKQQLQQQSQCSVDSLTTGVTTRQQREQQKKTTRRSAGTERKRERRRTAKEELLQQIQKADTEIQADEIAMEAVKLKEEPYDTVLDLIGDIFFDI